ncbi:hypothetical protein MSAN_01530100 [Mycena sanguinolenta]|uniref:Uncharacterized protein n=1 Tax=Mycena sanguinolenta TaxID=230812 RepID=A0A8H7CWZ4_9AGAR|nr:hypothetical protein MSAN_01530100 [Mycena sanguinolenta]
MSSFTGPAPTPHVMPSSMPHVIDGSTCFIPAATSSHFQVVSHDHITPRPVQPRSSFPQSHTSPTSHSNLDTSPLPSTHRKKRSCRCFVCGGTGKHRLHPRFCPRTPELISKKLAMFNFDFQLVSFDGSALPMTRHPGGVAGHLLSPRSLSACPPHVSLRQNPTWRSIPPHVAAAAATCPCIVEPSARTVEPRNNSNPPHVLHSSTVPQHPPSSCRSAESISPQPPPVKYLYSPSIYLPVHPLHSDSKPKVNPLDNSSPHVALSIFELLFISPPIRQELRKLIDAMDRLNTGHEIPTSPMLRRVFYRILDQIMASLSSLH